MLFRPYAEKRIFGVKVPLTPGLIPKGRLKLSEKLGKAVSESVLTKDVLNDAINSEEITAKINLLVSNAFDAFANSGITIESALSYLHIDGAALLKFLEMDYMPPEALMAFAEKSLPKLGGFILKLDEQAPALDQSLRELVYKVARENIGKFMSVFVNYEKIYASIKRGFADYLADGENGRAMLLRLKEILSDNTDGGEKIAPLIKNYSLSGLMAGLSPERREKALKFINSAMLRLLSSGGAYVIENLDFGKIIEDKLNSFEMKEAEELIVSVVNRELKAITVFGGILGFIIGLVPIALELLPFK
jgi:hypothetical protein